jgi:hypothetical protein
VFIQSKWELPHSEYSIEDIVRMEDNGDIISYFQDVYCTPFFCWDGAMEVVDKIELTPCNDGFPFVILSGKYFSIEIDGELFVIQREHSDNKLEILEELVYEFLNYYYTNVEKNN